MRRFSAWTAILTAAFTIAIMAMQLPRLLPTPKVLGFNPPGCELPCVLNIVPGITTAPQAEKILAANTSPENDDMDLGHRLDRPSTNQPYIQVSYTAPNPPRYVYR